MSDYSSSDEKVNINNALQEDPLQKQEADYDPSTSEDGEGAAAFEALKNRVSPSKKRSTKKPVHKLLTEDLDKKQQPEKAPEGEPPRGPPPTKSNTGTSESITRHGSQSSDTSQEAGGRNHPRRKQQFSDEDDRDKKKKHKKHKKAKKKHRRRHESEDASMGSSESDPNSDSDYKSKKKKKSKKSKAKKRAKSHRTQRHKSKYNTSDEDGEGQNDSSSDSHDDWSAGDAQVAYGSAEYLSEDSLHWECRSQELYDPDQPDLHLNAYHLESYPRLLRLQDHDEDGQLVSLMLQCLKIPNLEEQKKEKQQSMRLNIYTAKDRQNLDLVTHECFQRKLSDINDPNQPPENLPPVLTLHNCLSQEFIRGVIKSLTCPICQEMVSNPVIFKNCVHRFCSNCIETYNRQGKKECPLCRISINNRRQLRPDKNISALLKILKDEFKKLQRQEELENAEIRRKIILEQKRLKEKKDKQKRIVTNEMRRKNPESMEERRARQGMGGGKRPDPMQVDTKHILRMIQENLMKIEVTGRAVKKVDIEVNINYDSDQARALRCDQAQPPLIPAIRIMASRHMTLVHLSIMVASLNKLREEEWPNIEFYLCLKNNPFQETHIKKHFIFGQLVPFKFRMTLRDIVKSINPGTEDTCNSISLIYKKKLVPQINIPKMLAPSGTSLWKPPSGVPTLTQGAAISSNHVQNFQLAPLQPPPNETENMPLLQAMNEVYQKGMEDIIQ